MTSQSISKSIAPPGDAADAAGPAAVASRGLAHGPGARDFCPHLPLFSGVRLRKRWRYVAVFCDELMMCAAAVEVGGARQSFWAVLTREDGRLRERTHTLVRRSAVELTPGRLRVCDRAATLDLTLAEDDGVQARCPHGRGEVWTRKQAGIRAHGTVAFDGGPARHLAGLAVVDDTVGHHARVTEWRWAAGVGEAPSGTPLAFNLVEGVNDPPAGSERAVWVAGVPREVGPVSFAADLSQITAADGSALRFRTEAQRVRRENLLLVRSDYRASFATVSGRLPGGVELARGMGVVEHHRAVW